MIGGRFPGLPLAVSPGLPLAVSPDRKGGQASLDLNLQSMPAHVGMNRVAVRQS